MSEEITESEATPKKSKIPILIALFATILLGGGGFYATFSGLLNMGDPHDAHEETASESDHRNMDDVEFITVNEIVINIGHDTHTGHLRFVANLEVPKEKSADVHLLMPRIVDVLNGYLRAVDIELLTDHTTLPRLKAQMLRRVQLVTGEAYVIDLLIAEFTLS